MQERLPASVRHGYLLCGGFFQGRFRHSDCRLRQQDCHGDGPFVLSLSVSPESSEANLFGKTVSELQTGIVVGDSEITGTLNYVTGYTGFDSNPEKQSGNYLALKIDATSGSTTTVEVVGGDKGPVTLDSDMNIVLFIKSTTQSVKVVTSMGDESIEKTYALTRLTLTPAD